MGDNVTNLFICVDTTMVREIQSAVLIHSYIFGGLCLALLLLTSYITYKLIRKRHKIRFLLTIEILAIAFFSFRVLFLLIDPYRIRGIVPEIIGMFLEDLALPCLTSAFALVQLTFWELTKIRIMEMYRLSLLIGFILTHFVVILLIDFVVIFAQGFCVLLVVCQLLTIAWGLILSCGFFCTIRRLHIIQKDNNNTLRRKQVTSSGQQDTNISSVSTRIETPHATIQINLPDTTSSHGFDSITTEPSPKRTKSNNREVRPSSPKSRNRNKHLQKVTIVGIAAMILGSSCFCLGVCGMIFFSNPSRPDFNIWGWFVYQNLQRSLELGFGVTMAYLAWQRNG
ncbi:uncharacterized protein [Asterias amurensis]|uniref:uncharacterized protein n=1 Tax=Asterias amurensis TaxID=7602 RepID=UPI003AB1F615